MNNAMMMYLLIVFLITLGFDNNWAVLRSSTSISADDVLCKVNKQSYINICVALLK